MMRHRLPTRFRSAAAFTLLEILLAGVMVAVLLSALFVVFQGAMRLRQTTEAMLAVERPVVEFRAPLRLDLENCLAPGGLLAGPLLGKKSEKTGVRQDTLELFTTSGRITDGSPWGEICKVNYDLTATEEGNSAAGFSLVRTLTRNLLATTDSTPESAVVLDRVASLAFNYYDGENWQDSWDATSAPTVVPTAISVDIAFVAPQEGERARAPIAWVFEVAAQPTTTPTPGASSGGGGAS